MTKYQIELQVEHFMSRLDYRLMNAKMHQAEYNREVAKLNEWARQQAAR